jgi:hypothetical protein
MSDNTVLSNYIHKMDKIMKVGLIHGMAQQSLDMFDMLPVMSRDFCAILLVSTQKGFHHYGKMGVL